MTDVERYILARWTYGLGEPIMSDSDYTILDNYFKYNNTLPEYTNRTWSEDPCPTELLKEAGLDHLICYFETVKTESIPSLGTWGEIKSFYKDLSEKSYASYKHDGFNIQIHYMNGKLIKAHSRGRATDVTLYDCLLPHLPQKIDTKEYTVIVAEATLSENALEVLRKKYPEKNLKTTRSSVRTALVTVEDAALVNVTAFDILGLDDMDMIIERLKEWKFNTPIFTEVFDFDNLKNVFMQMSENRENYEKNYTTDGVVIRNAKKRIMRALRVEAWQEEVLQTFVTGYNENHTAYYIPMTLDVFPVNYKGKTHRVVPITNLARVISNNLTIGAPVAFRIKSDASPVIDELATRILQETHPNYAIYRKIIEMGAD